jgi:hypothetical protein
MNKFTYKDLELEIVERSITIGGLHRIVLQANNGKKFNLTSNRSIKLAKIPKAIEEGYERIKFFIS